MEKWEIYLLLKFKRIVILLQTGKLSEAHLAHEKDNWNRKTI